MENFDLLNDEKVKYVEGKAAECYTYLMESRDILLREAHTTINWLFAVIVGATGYLLKLLESHEHPSQIFSNPHLGTTIQSSDDGQRSGCGDDRYRSRLVDSASQCEISS